MSLRYFTNFVLSLFMIAILVFLYTKVQSLNIDDHYEITDTLRQHSSLNFRWNEQVLKTKLSLSSNYDSVTNPLVDLRSLQNKLNTKLSELSVESSSLKESVEQYNNSIEEKNKLIEQFKGQNAIFDNSLRYISTAIEDLVSEIDSQSSSNTKPNPTFLALKSASQTLLRELLEFNQSAQQNLAEPITEQLRILESQKKSFPDTISVKLDAVIRHALVVVKRKPEIDSLLAKIVSLPISTNIEKIENAYTAVYDSRVRDKDFYFTTLIAYAGVLLALLAFIGYRLRNSYRQLNVLNKQLTVANETLEERVAQRTEELSTAYNELKQSQAQLIQSEKMASLGQMVAGVAHEINTPLAYCHSNIDLVKEQLPDIITLFKEFANFPNLLDAPESEQQALKEGLGTIQEAMLAFEKEGSFDEMNLLLEGSLSGLNQISDMVKSLKDFSRLDQHKVENSDLNKGLDSVLVIANNVLKNKVEIIKDYGEIPKISCSPSQLNQVFLNLIVNASQAIEDTGTITLRTYSTNNFVNINIEDTGKGIPQDILPRIFDPFFTTKEIGKGTGLGLSIAYKIIQQHGGTITVRSEVNKGTQFTVSLPVNQKTDFKNFEVAA